MNETILLRAIFAQTRYQIVGGATEEDLKDAYLYAWEKGLYPSLHDGDSSVPDLPHEPLESMFITKKEFVENVLEYIDSLWLEHKPPSFYELEDKYGGRETRSALIHILRYCFLQGLFDEELWKAIIKNCPAEARSIVR